MAPRIKPKEVGVAADYWSPGAKSAWASHIELVRDEENRHRCEVRHVLQLRKLGREAVDRYSALVARKRGSAAADKLLADAAEQWSLGNRGNDNDWRQKEAA